METQNSSRIRTSSHGNRQWPVVALLALLVLLPSATVLWLTHAAVQNEHAAIRERLKDGYRKQLQLAAKGIDEHWDRVDKKCAVIAERSGAQELLRQTPEKTGELESARLSFLQTVRNYTIRVPSSQRQFAMQRYLSVFSGRPDADAAKVFPTLEAGMLATEYAEELTRSGAASVWSLSQNPNCIVLPSAPIVLLFHERSLRESVSSTLARWQSEGFDVKLVSSTAPRSGMDVDARIDSMPHRSLSLTLKTTELPAGSLYAQTSLYTLAGLVTIAAATVSAMVVAIFVRRQLRLAQMKNDLASTVSHELRTPLASIRVLVDTLLEESSGGSQRDHGGSAGGDRQTEYLQLIARENERLSRLVDNFLTYGRIQRGRERFDFRQCDPVEHAQRAISAMGPKLNDPDCDFKFEAPCGLPKINVDEEAIVIVFLNLLDNALKFTRKKKTIRFRLSRDQRCIAFQFEDNGVGLSPRERRRVFEKFFQVDTRLTRSHGGCGIGLSLVESIVQSHNGFVVLDDKESDGSIFTIRIPECRSGEPECRSGETECRSGEAV